MLQKFIVRRVESGKWKVVLGFIKWALCSSSKIVMAQSPPFIGGGLGWGLARREIIK